MMFRWHVLTIWILLGTDAVRLKTDKSVLNICMDGRHHYHQPVATKLFGVCKPWESWSCCSNDTAFHLQKPFSPLYNFNLSHCHQWTDKCLQRFYMSNCFYECSPNVGPWLRRDRSSIRNERFVDVPVCQSDCDAWWDDCKDQMTCVDDFSSFSWINGSNHCPPKSQCTTFQSRFHNATYFCEHIYRGDYKTVNDSTRCMKFDIRSAQNPNAKVAELYAKQKGLYNPDVDEQKKDVGTSASPRDDSGNSTSPQSPTGYSSETVIALVVVIVVLLSILTVICVCKFRDVIETSKRAGISYLPRCNWLSKAKTSTHSIVHHQALVGDDRRYLQNDDEDDDDLNPHGALEIDL